MVWFSLTLMTGVFSAQGTGSVDRRKRGKCRRRAGGRGAGALVEMRTGGAARALRRPAIPRGRPHGKAVPRREPRLAHRGDAGGILRDPLDGVPRRDGVVEAGGREGGEGPRLDLLGPVRSLRGDGARGRVPAVPDLCGADVRHLPGSFPQLALALGAAAANGFYRDVAGVGFVGCHIVLKTNDTFDLYKINNWASLGNCSGTASSWSIGTQTLQGNYSFPTNGVIFIEDHVVIDGQINGARLTVTAADLPAPSDPVNYKNIIINNDLSYTYYDS